MIKQHDSIQYRNVVSQKMIIHPHQMEEAMEFVKTTLIEMGATLTGRFFYILEDLLEADDLQIELFFEVTQNNLAIAESMNFHSYYYIHSMLSIYAPLQREEEALFAYIALVNFAEKNDLAITTPFFHEVVEFDGLKRLHIKAGTRALTATEIWI